MQEEITLSVVVIGRNEGSRLLDCLDSIHNIIFPMEKRELIYVDSHSTDGSIEEARARGAKVIAIEHPEPTAAYARNKGWKASRGKYIMFLDSDTVIDSQFISRALSEFADPQIGIVSGILRERHPSKTIFNQVFDLDWNIETKEYCGGNALAKRQALEKVDGFVSELIAGEEPEMCQRLKLEGYNVKHIAIPMAVHDLDITSIKQYWRRCFRSGYAYACISRFFSSSSDPLWKYESRHNLIKGSLLILGIILSALSLFTSFFYYPIFFYLVFFSGLVIRTALKTRTSHSWKTAILYGIHAHFQHIPMFFGQLFFWYDTNSKKKRSIIEYK
jgi:glycosyltransferase involved in cell wall biosynthesis